MRYSDEFKVQAIKKVLENEGIKSKLEIAKELNVSKATLYKWVKKATNSYDNNKSFSSEAQLQILKESYNLKDEELNAYCRKRGIFEHQIKAFEANFLSQKVITVSSSKKELDAQRLKNKELEKELRRKEKALAETAALLVLQKKFQALFQDEE